MREAFSRLPLPCLVVHGQGLDKVTRQHLERAMNHLQEGYIAIAAPGCSRTVDQLVADNKLVEDMVSKAFRKTADPGDGTQPRNPKIRL